MLLTESEAREKWCPFVRGKIAESETDGVPNCPEPQTTFNRVFINEGASFVPKQSCCIASDCMAWQFMDTEKDLKMFDKRSGKQLGDGEHTDLSHAEHRVVENNHRRGFCALAGRPDQ